MEISIRKGDYKRERKSRQKIGFGVLVEAPAQRWKKYKERERVKKSEQVDDDHQLRIQSRPIGSQIRTKRKKLSIMPMGRSNACRVLASRLPPSPARTKVVRIKIHFLFVDESATRWRKSGGLGCVVVMFAVCAMVMQCETIGGHTKASVENLHVR